MQVLFEDHHLLAVNKPAPLLTQAPAEVPSLEAQVKAYIKEKYAKPAGVYLGIPHRLDRPVSGVIVFCRNTKAAQRVAVQFQQHLVQKVYWAWTEGTPALDHEEWRDWLLKIPDEARTRIVPPDTPHAKEAITIARVLQRTAHGTLWELSPRTGRMHQLRVQAAQRGWPIAGDALYGSSRSFGPMAEFPRERAIGLHARRITLEHPFRHEPLTIEAPLPEMWRREGMPSEFAM